MPFTLSHPAAVLPIARWLARWRLLSAVVIGSMVPDLGWVSPWGLSRPETHSAKGLLTFCLPLGLAAYWVFQRILKTPLVELLPPAAYARFRDFELPARLSDLKQWALAVGGVLCGAITHLVWDEFTHKGARGVRMLPELSDRVIAGRHLAGAQLLEDVSSAIGLLIVLAVLAYALRPGSPADTSVQRRLSSHERRTWLVVYVLVAVVSSGIFFVIMRRGTPHIPGVFLHVSDSAIAILRGTLTALLLVSVGLGARLRLRSGVRRPP